jgi:hypothetical protein
MSTKGVIISKETPKVVAVIGDLRVSGIIAGAIAVADKFVLDTVYKVNSIADAENTLGIDAAYDLTNKVALHHHISEFYHEVGLDSNVPFYIMGVAQGTTLEEMVDPAGTIGKKFINDSEGKPFQFGIALNPDVDYVPTILDGMDEDVWNAIPKAQALVDWAFDKMYPTRVIIEGRSFTPNGAAAGDLRDIDDVKAPNVHIVVAQDYDYAEKDALLNKYAAVGTVLGTVASANVHENIGWVEKFNLTDAGSGRWLNAGFSNHTDAMAAQDNWELIDQKGYIFAMKYPRVDGFRWNNDHACTPIEVDAEGSMNEAYILFGRTMDNVVLSVFSALIGRVKSPQPVDPTTGKLPLAVIVDFKTRGEKQIDQDLAGKISGREVLVDKNSNLLPPSETLNLAVKCVPYGSAQSIKVKVGLVRNL